MRARATTTVPFGLLALFAAAACNKPTGDSPPPAAVTYPPAVPDGKVGPILADLGFRPEKDGFRFQNQGGAYPRTPPVLTAQDVDQMFGDSVCLSGTGSTCKLTPVASEWMATVNHAMNQGQCEGMAVSSLAFFQKLYSPQKYAAHARSIQDLTHAETAPLIGYFWAYQMVDPVKSDRNKSAESSTPVSVEASLIDMFKRNEPGVIAIWAPQGGHAVTPYSVEDRGDGVHWIHIYDNNWPDKERHIVIDHKVNSWRYDLAALNPNIPREPWQGDATTHTIAVTPLSDRLGKADCPFCSGGMKMIMPFGGTNGVVLTNGDGKKVGRVGDKIVNEIPGAQVAQIAGYLEGSAPSEPILYVPEEGDYQVSISGREHANAKEDPEAEHGVAVIGSHAAVTVEGKVNPGEPSGTLSIAHDGGVKYKTGKAGQFPTIRLAANGANGGMHARISNMQADANDEVGLKLDHAAGQVVVSGGGKKASSFDLKVTHVATTGEDKVNEQKGIKFEPGKVHTVQSSPTGGAFKVVAKVAPPPEKEPVKPGEPAASPAPAATAAKGKDAAGTAHPGLPGKPEKKK
jgi:hypothetical protein